MNDLEKAEAALEAAWDAWHYSETWDAWEAVDAWHCSETWEAVEAAKEAVMAAKAAQEKPE